MPAPLQRWLEGQTPSIFGLNAALNQSRTGEDVLSTKNFFS
jgi:hypothetical protein